VILDPAAQKTILRERYDDGAWESRSILGELDRTQDLYFDRVSQIRMERWSRGRVALVGDAAFCVSLVAGQGAALAMTAAYVLAGELTRSSGAYGRAFTQYELAMRDYVKQCQELPPGGVEGMLPRTRRAMWMRNQSMRMLTRWPLRNFAAGMFHKADAIVLDDYPALSKSMVTC